MTHALYTVGHSNMALEEFIALLKLHEVERVADIRRLPGDKKHPLRKNPQFTSTVLAEALRAEGIQYVQIPELGGRRPKHKNHDISPNTAWENESFGNYADYALYEKSFLDGLYYLFALMQGCKTAAMCGESKWWQCHRRIVSDYMIALRRDVFHIMGSREVKHTLSAFASVQNAYVIYDGGLKHA